MLEEGGGRRQGGGGSSRPCWALQGRDYHPGGVREEGFMRLEKGAAAVGGVKEVYQPREGAKVF